MSRTYDELLKDTNFMEMIFTEISKLDKNLINKKIFEFSSYKSSVIFVE